MIQIIATTISKITIDELFDSKYDVVMFDEVSMAYVPQLICAASYAREHFICVGDFRQLAPIAQSDSANILQKDIFSFLNINDYANRIFPHEWLVMLDEQRRMHPKISFFSNAYIYNRLLKNHESVNRSRDAIAARDPLHGEALSLIDLSGTYCAASKNSDNSRYNILSALISFAIVASAVIKGEDNAGIISPYAAQTRLIRAIIQDYEKKEKLDIICSTVHQFQGSERNLIVFDAVESYPSTKPGWLMSKNENASVMRLINVAITRARGKFVTVANKRFWYNKFESSQHIFYLLLKHISSFENVISNSEKQLVEFLKTLSFGPNIKYFHQVDNAISQLLNNIAIASDEIIVSIPDGNLTPEYEHILLKALDMARKNGVCVKMKSNGYEDLPEAWKNMCFETDNAVFPLIFIDRKTIWYDMPICRGLFQDAKIGFRTVCRTIFRIKGENTVDMIASLTDIDYCTLGKVRMVLDSKDEFNKSEKTPDCYAKYVETHMRCI